MFSGDALYVSSSSSLESAGCWFVGLTDTYLYLFSWFPTYILYVFIAIFKISDVHLKYFLWLSLRINHELVIK